MKGLPPGFLLPKDFQNARVSVIIRIGNFCEKTGEKRAEERIMEDEPEL